jgi:uncharacterized protein YbjT (DUF2867 family)
VSRPSLSRRFQGDGSGGVHRVRNRVEAVGEEVSVEVERHRRDVVVWSAGAGGGSPERTYAVDRDAAIRTIDAAGRANASKFVMVSYFGAGPGHGVDPSSDFFAYAESKTVADAHLAASSLAWTVLRPSRLTEEAGTGGIEAGAGVTGGQVARATVADVITAVIAAPDAAKGLTLEFNDGEQPIGDVIAG